jgi:hypothetical protein
VSQESAHRLAYSNGLETAVRQSHSPAPRGRKLVTLKDAANYIQKLPKAVAGAAKCDRANMTFFFGKSALRRITRRHQWQ